MQDHADAAVHDGFQHPVVGPAQLRQGHARVQALAVMAGAQSLLAQAFLQGQGQTQGRAFAFDAVMAGLLLGKTGHGQQTAAGHDPGQGPLQQHVQAVPLPEPVPGRERGRLLPCLRNDGLVPAAQLPGQAQAQAEPEDAAQQQAGGRTRPPGGAFVSARGAGMGTGEDHGTTPRGAPA